MQNAYDLKDLGEKIIEHAKENGLEIAEDAVEKLGKAVYHAATEWMKESAALSTNHVDDMVVPFINYFDSQVEDQIEKIDLDGDGD